MAVNRYRDEPRPSDWHVLEMVDLVKRYDDVVALDSLSLTARPGRILGFLGPNGAGKTTAMRSVFGLVQLDAGKVIWRAEPITASSRNQFGYMPEQRGLYPRMAAGAQLAFFAQLHGVEPAQAASAAHVWLERLGLDDRHDDKVSALSHGNQQRVQLAAALVHDPDLLVLDEPFSGLDPLGVSAMSEVLVKRAQEGATVVFSSHQLDLVEDLVDDVVIISHGKARMQGTLDEVRASTGTQRVAFRLAGTTQDQAALLLKDSRLPTGLDLNGHGLQSQRDGLSVLAVETGTDPTEVMTHLSGLGRLERFTFEPPSLSHVFRDVVGMSIAEAEAAHHDRDDQ